MQSTFKETLWNTIGKASKIVRKWPFYILITDQNGHSDPVARTPWMEALLVVLSVNDYKEGKANF